MRTQIALGVVEQGIRAQPSKPEFADLFVVNFHLDFLRIHVRDVSVLAHQLVERLRHGVSHGADGPTPEVYSFILIWLQIPQTKGSC